MGGKVEGFEIFLQGNDGLFVCRERSFWNCGGNLKQEIMSETSGHYRFSPVTSFCDGTEKKDFREKVSCFLEY